MEGCMRFVFAAAFGLLAYILFPAWILGIPFNQYSLGDMLRLVGAAIFGILAFQALLKKSA